MTLVVMGTLLVNVTTVYGNEFKFSVDPTIPKSQLNQDNTFFDIKLKPNQKETLKVDLRNDSDHEVEVDVSVNSATTNSNVVIEYGSNDIKKDASLTYAIEDYVDYPKLVKLKPRSTKTVSFLVKMPNQKFDGVIAGGITFKEVIKEDKQEKDEQGLSIKNEYSYVVALLMRQNKNKVEPNLILKSVNPDQINSRNVILANLQNDKKTYINQVVMVTKITKKGSDDVLYEATNSALQIAPNTSFPFPTPLNDSPLEPGRYELDMTVYGNEDKTGEHTRKTKEETTHYSNKWKFKKEFRVSRRIAEKLNEKDVTIKDDSFNWYWLLLVLPLLIIPGTIWWLWHRKKEKQKPRKNKKKIKRTKKYKERRKNKYAKKNK